MPVMVLKVARQNWNQVELAASLHGVDVTPDLPEGEVTRVELTGSVPSLQATLSRAGRGPVFEGLYESLPNGEQ